MLPPGKKAFLAEETEVQRPPSWDACLSHEPEAGKGESGRRCWESRGSQWVGVSILSEKGSAKSWKSVMTWLVEDGVEIGTTLEPVFFFFFSPGERQWWLDHSGCRSKAK